MNKCNICPIYYNLCTITDCFLLMKEKLTQLWNLRIIQYPQMFTFDSQPYIGCISSDRQEVHSRIFHGRIFRILETRYFCENERKPSDHLKNRGLKNRITLPSTYAVLLNLIANLAIVHRTMWFCKEKFLFILFCPTHLLSCKHVSFNFLWCVNS